MFHTKGSGVQWNDMTEPPDFENKKVLERRFFSHTQVQQQRLPNHWPSRHWQDIFCICAHLRLCYAEPENSHRNGDRKRRNITVVLEIPFLSPSFTHPS